MFDLIGGINFKVGNCGCVTARGGGGCLGAVLKPGLARDGPAVNGRVDEEALGKGGGLNPMFTLESGS